MKRPGRNQPCPCGSGIKFKKCCASTWQPQLRASPMMPVSAEQLADPEFQSIFLGLGTEDLTDELIADLSENRGWPKGALERFREEGACYNSVRDSIQFPTEFGGPMFDEA